LDSSEAIEEYLNRLEHEIKALKEEALRICWWMRGSISYDDSMMLSHDDRIIINNIIKENLESSKKSGQLIY
jgi:hypothetical protein